MRKIMIATHGYLANGIKSSIELLTGKKENVSYLNAYVDDKDYTLEIKKFMESIGEEDEAVIFTDIYGGSVNQKAVLMLPEDKKIFLITGFNLPVVIEILLFSEPLNDTVVKRIIEESRIQLLDVSKINNKSKCKAGKEECDDFLAK